MRALPAAAAGSQLLPASFRIACGRHNAASCTVRCEWQPGPAKRRQAGQHSQRRRLQCSAGRPQADASPVERPPANAAAGGRKVVVTQPPPGAEANNAVALRRRRERQQRDDATAAAAAVAFSTEAAPAAKASAAVSETPSLSNTQQIPAQAIGSVLGTVALITGSTVGAGILALPAVTAPAGFVPSTGALGVFVLLLPDAACQPTCYSD